MKLLVHTYDPSDASHIVRQAITVGAEPIMLYAIRPHLVKYGSPAGSLYLQVQDANGNKVGNSETVALSTISSANHFHGYVRFLCSIPLVASTTYFIALKSSGYTYGGSAYVGWCNDYDLRKVEATYTNVSTLGMSAPLDMELWSYSQLSRGQV